MSRWKLGLGIAGAVVVTVAGIAVVRSIGRPGPTVPTMTVKRAPFRVRVTADGNLAAVQSTPLSAPMNPPTPFTLAWLVEDGTVIDEGDIIARFDASQLEKDRDDWLSYQRISDLRIDSAQTSRDVNVDKLARDVEVAGHQLGVAREFQSTDSLVYSKIEIVEAQIDTELAETRSEHARESQNIQTELYDAEIELLSIERRKADIKVGQAVEGLSALEVRSPHGGIVMLERDWRGNPVRVGDTVWPGRPLARIPDLTEMQAEVFVLEADAGDLADGQNATIRLEASPGISHAATVKKIDPMAGRRNRRVPVQYFRTVLSLAETDTATMKPGTRVRSEIVIADFDAAITVPRQAVCSVGGQPAVYRWAHGVFEPIVVGLGPAAIGRVVIASGLDPGDVIALRDPTATNDAGSKGAEDSGSPTLPGAGS